MHHLGERRYSPQGNSLSPSNRQSSLNEGKLKYSYAATLLSKKEEQVQILKRRISALCVKQYKTNHQTLNNDALLDKRQKVQSQSLQIKILLEKQRAKDAQRIRSMKNRNLQSRVDNYYRAKNLKKQQYLSKKQSSEFIRSRSKQNQQIISLHKNEEITEKKTKKYQINRSEMLAKVQTSRIKQSRIKNIKEIQKLQAEHLLKLGGLKDNQLTKLGQLELLMVEKNTTSKIAYEASRQRLNSIYSVRRKNSNFTSNSIIKSARESSSRRNTTAFVTNS